MLSRRVSRIGLTVAVMLGAAIGAHAAAPAYAQIRFKPAGKPVVYLRFEGDSLYMATSAAGLKTAKPIRPATGGNGAEAMSYAPVDLPAAAPGITKATVAFGIQRNGATPAINGDFTIRRKDKTGASWEYAYFAGGRAKDATSPQQPYVIDVPSFDKWAMGVETKVEKGKVGIGLRLKADGQAIREAKKGGKPAAARVQVLDEKGKVIETATGDLAKFGFTWGGPCYSVRVAKKGTYTVKASADVVPGGKPVTAETKFTIR